MNYSTRFVLLCLIVLSFFKVSANGIPLHKHINPALDSAGVANCYAEGAEILNDGRRSTIGKAAIMHFYGNMIGYGITKFNYTTADLLGGGNNLITEEGNLTFAVSSAKVVVKGRFLLVWKRENGHLKIFRDTFFSDSK